MNFTLVVMETMCGAHRTLVEMGLKGDPPTLNFHTDGLLPPCVYQPRTNALAICSPLLRTLSEDGVRGAVLDAMAMCGCQRSYRSDLRDWNMTQNKGRMKLPVLAMHGGPKWRSIRAKLRGEHVWFQGQKTDQKDSCGPRQVGGAGS